MRLSFLSRVSTAAITAWLSLVALAAWAQLPSFNGAEGYGGTFSGSAPAGGWFSNATVYHVTTTADQLDGNGKPVPGTLRGAFYDYTNPNSPKQQATNRIVVFHVGGTFDISAASLDLKTITNIYVAGQTAPSPVTVYGNTTQITKSSNTMTSNVILRHMTFRKGTGGGEDAITFAGGSGAGDMIATSMILDHVSASWSEDENLSIANNNTNVTVQYSIINDALVSNHAFGSLIRPRVDSNVSFHHNLYANNSSRQARFGTYDAETLTADFRNNVVYNWRDRASYAGGSSDPEQEFADINYVGNYFIAGQGTTANASTAFVVDKNVTARVHQYGNAIDSDGPALPGLADGTGKYNGVDTGWGMFGFNSPITDQTLEHMDLTQFATAPVTTQTAVNAYNQVLNYAGNSWWNRDIIDLRVANNVRDYTNPGIGALAPNSTELAAVTGATATSRPAGWDTDNDGMPNNWELAHSLNPNSSADFKLDLDGDLYVNLQEYLDEVGAFPAPTPLTYVGPASGAAARYALITNWKTSDLIEAVAAPDPPIVHAGTNWQPSRFDEAQINGGIVSVDLAGQHARVLKLAANSGNSATLNVTGGWLKVEQEVIIGGVGATAALNLSGGTLRTTTLNKGSGGSFSFTGGKLSADTVSFSLVNNGGTLAPGDSIGATHTNSVPTNIGTTHILGDLTLSSGSLQIELSSPAIFDKLLVDGTATLGGSLTVSPLGGFAPVTGNSWPIIAAAGFSGQFASISAGYTVQQQGNNLVLFFGNPFLAGDYNNDGFVNANDYVVWRRAMSSGGTLLNETASPGVVDQADYSAWRANFGAGPGNGAAAGFNAVPELGSVGLLAWLIGLGFCSRSCRYGIRSRLRISGTFLQE